MQTVVSSMAITSIPITAPMALNSMLVVLALALVGLSTTPGDGELVVPAIVLVVAIILLLWDFEINTDV
jgi:hypothetical protein